MSVINNSTKIQNQQKITIVIGLISILTVGMTSQFQQQSNALDINELGNFKGLSELGPSNNCVAFECNNHQTVDNSKTITDNSNSNIVSESDNTNIVGPNGDSSPPDLGSGQLGCFQCFQNSGISSDAIKALALNLVPPGETYQDICEKLPVISEDEFLKAISNIGPLISSEQVEQLINCLKGAGYFQF